MGLNMAPLQEGHAAGPFTCLNAAMLSGANPWPGGTQQYIQYRYFFSKFTKKSQIINSLL